MNGAVGGTQIQDHLRNSDNPQDYSTIYGRLLSRIVLVGIKENIKGIFWYQGENSSDPSYINYADNFQTLYSNWKLDYPSIKKIFLFQVRPGCGGEFQREVREIQRNISNSYSDVAVISTVGVPGHDGCHDGFRTWKPTHFPTIFLE